MEQITLGGEKVEQTLRITNVLADPTRFYIYQYIIKNHHDVTVQEIADSFDIHPNVARLHLSKLEDVNMLVSETRKTGKGGRPSRLYRLSDKVIQLHFPSRDYQLLAKIAIESMSKLGEQGIEALSHTGRTFGQELVNQQLAQNAITFEHLSFQGKVNLLNNVATAAGFSPNFQLNSEENEIVLRISNCPFSEIAVTNRQAIATMHAAFLNGIVQAVFDKVELVEIQDSISEYAFCTYKAIITK